MLHKQPNIIIKGTKKEFKQIWIRKNKELWKTKIKYGQFVREMLETTDERETWT